VSKEIEAIKPAKRKDGLTGNHAQKIDKGPRKKTKQAMRRVSGITGRKPQNARQHGYQKEKGWET